MYNDLILLAKQRISTSDLEYNTKTWFQQAELKGYNPGLLNIHQQWMCNLC